MENKIDISSFVKVLTEQSVTNEIVKNVKLRRKELGYSQLELSKRSGVSFGSIKRFETTGDISLSSLLKIANALGSLSDFEKSFNRKIITNLKDLKND